MNKKGESYHQLNNKQFSFLVCQLYSFNFQRRIAKLAKLCHVMDYRLQFCISQTGNVINNATTDAKLNNAH